MIIDGNQCCNSFPKTGSTGSLSLSLSWDSLHVHFIHIYCVTKAIFVWNYDATASRSRDVLHVFDIHLFSALQVGEWIWASCRPAPHLWPAETKCLLSLVPVFLPLQASLYKVSFPVRWLRNARSWQLLKSSVSIAGWGTKKKVLLSCDKLRRSSVNASFPVAWERVWDNNLSLTQTLWFDSNAR